MTEASSDPAIQLSNERLRLSLAVRDWILGEAREIGDPNIILEGVSLMLRDAGIPIDRATSAVELRHAERAANARIWEFGSSAREYVYAHERGSDASGKRPLAEAHRLNRWIFTWLPDTPDDAYDIVAPLKATASRIVTRSATARLISTWGSRSTSATPPTAMSAPANDSTTP
jgi:adenylate cyclase